VVSSRVVKIDDRLLTAVHLQVVTPCGGQFISGSKKTEKNKKGKGYKLRSNSKQSEGIHVISPEEERKATVGRICRKGRF